MEVPSNFTTDLIIISRLSVSSLAPVSKSTIVYGTYDACLTFFDNSVEFRSMIRKTCELLNLESHYVGPLNALCYGPADMEVSNNRFFSSNNRFSILKNS
jgi:hypothetical protein